MGIRITAPADSTADLHGHAGGTISMPVTNSGTVPIVVTADAETITAKAQAHPATSWITGIEPHVLHLAPGKTGHVVLTIKVPAGAHGVHFTNVLFRTGAAGHGSVKLAGGVGGTLRIVHAGTVPASYASPQASVPPAGGMGWLVPVVVVAVVLVAVLAMLAARLRHRGGHRA